MSLQVASINSGSNGNCYYVGNEHEAVLVDAGISCRETVRRMRNIGLSMDKVKAIFISHEHGDHIRGLDVLSSRYQVPVYITPVTLQHSRLKLEQHLTQPFQAHEIINIGGLTIQAFPKRHDAADPHSFIISGNGINIGVLTDIGSACEHVIENFKRCHAAFLEANYDEAMLENGRYPHHLKKRISGSEGHLSNMQALQLFLAHRPPFMSHLILSHLSKDNNHPDIAAGLFSEHAANTTIAVASRYEESPVYHITTGSQMPVTVKHAARTKQISLF